MVNSGTLREWGVGFRNPTSLFPSLVVLKEVSSDAAPRRRLKKAHAKPPVRREKCTPSLRAISREEFSWLFLS